MKEALVVLGGVVLAVVVIAIVLSILAQKSRASLATFKREASGR